ncbi:MAG TPA: adenosylcobinamide-phosphate synthase CbiB [Candidatus Butyricicoccus stercorigallinarum]|nr:adenosylcobinamide-phosphate synthase CbiB [Candidatus Butyricicoccus stercorigallinarum]
MSIVGAVLLGFLIDCVLGDPQRLWHPICGIGAMISFWQKRLRARFPDTPRGQFWAGVLLWPLVVVPAWFIPFALLTAAGWLHPAARFALETVFCWQIFAAKSLKTAALRVYDALVARDLPGARTFVSWIVGRDTAALSAEQVTKAAVETVAENASDGVIAPLCFLLLGGAPLGFAYKAVNTLDSMVGYKNDEFLYFGRFSAKMDDVFNFIPARLSGLLFVLSAKPAGLSARGAWRCFRRDRLRHASPNSAQTEAACAGALGVQLAGDAYYFGKRYKKPTLGDDQRPIEPEDIVRTNRLMMWAAVLAVVLLCALRAAIVTFF